MSEIHCMGTTVEVSVDTASVIDGKIQSSLDAFVHRAHQNTAEPNRFLMAAQARLVFKIYDKHILPSSDTDAIKICKIACGARGVFKDMLLHHENFRPLPLAGSLPLEASMKVHWHSKVESLVYSHRLCSCGKKSCLHPLLSIRAASWRLVVLWPNMDNGKPGRPVICYS